jgi:magnesium chelatase subunit I
MGHRGCAKSTLARAFGALVAALPSPGGAAPFVEIPLGVSEDRLLGAVDAAPLLAKSQWKAQKGLIEAADGGVLYVDEINLLPDTLADLLLDCAASGVYRLERDGFSRVVQSRFLLIGTMNPEEGELRPQLSDRFSHGVRIQSPATPAARMEIARRALAYDEDPEAFCRDWHSDQNRLLRNIAEARENLTSIRIPDEIRLQIAERAHLLGLEGMRAEIGVLRTVRSAAAWEKITTPTREHVDEAWELCLGHRAKSPPPPQAPPPSPTTPNAPANAQARSATPGHDSALGNSAGSALPRFPKSAYPDPIPLTAPPKTPLGEPIQARLVSQKETQGSAFGGIARFQNWACPQSSQRIRWHASLVASLLRGWKAGGSGWHWVRTQPEKVRRIWVFLDASRSAGSGGSLGWFRGALGEWLPRGFKIRLLLLHGNLLRWAGLDASASSISKRVSAVPGAAGGSPLSAAIHQLARDVQRSGGGPYAAVLFCSDGLAQPTSGQNPTETRRILNRGLHKLGKMLPAGRFLWMAPPVSKVQAGWLPRLLEGTGAVLVPAKKSFPAPGEHFAAPHGLIQ